MAQHWRLAGKFNFQEGELYRRGRPAGSSFVSRDRLAPDPARCDTVSGERGLVNPFLVLSNRLRFTRAQTCLILRPAGDRWSCSVQKNESGVDLVSLVTSSKSSKPFENSCVWLTVLVRSIRINVKRVVKVC